MVAAEYIEYEEESHEFFMTDEQSAVLVDEDSPLFVGGAFHFTTPSILNTKKIMQIFKDGGGIPYSDIGDEIPEAIERLFRPGYVNFLTRDWLASVPGLINKLENSAKIADIGCGCGQSSIAMAEAFPNATVLGIDYHAPSIKRAIKLAKTKGLKNIEFLEAPAHEIPSEENYDLICSFDCIHDMVDPKLTLKSIRAAIGDSGHYVWSEPNVHENPLKRRDPVGKAFSALSPLHCLTVSLAYGGEGLGTVMGENNHYETCKRSRVLIH